jgi:membrane protein YdbS with pleckstrin-like domain
MDEWRELFSVASLPPTSDRGREEPEETTDDADSVTAAWFVIGTMIAFKLGLTAYILLAYPSAKNLLFQLAFNWPWLLAVVVLLTPPGLFWWRLWRVRARRAALQRAEWHVEDH